MSSLVPTFITKQHNLEESCNVCIIIILKQYLNVCTHIEKKKSVQGIWETHVRVLGHFKFYYFFIEFIIQTL